MSDKAEDKTFVRQGPPPGGPADRFIILSMEDRKIHGKYDCGDGRAFYLVNILANMDEVDDFWRYWTMVCECCVTEENFPKEELEKFGLVKE